MIHEKTISELVNELRTKGWSDAAIGRELEVSVPTVFRWRTVKREHHQVDDGGGTEILRRHPMAIQRRALKELLER